MIIFITGIKNQNIELEIPLKKKDIEEVVNELVVVIKQQQKEIEELKKIQSVQDQKLLKELNDLKVSISNSGFNNAYETSFIGSTILDENRKFILSHLIKKIKFSVDNSLEKYEKMEKRKIMSKLLYKASVDGDDYKIFHKKCDNKGETVTIINSEQNKLFGIYAIENWDISKEKQYDYSGYLFSLDARKYFTSWGIFPSYKDYGPNIYCTYEGKFYLYVSNLCLHNNKSYIDNQYKQINNGVNNFKIKDYEVFSIMVI